MPIPYPGATAAGIRLTRKAVPPPAEDEGGLIPAVASGLSYVGESLSKPSRAVWGTAEGLLSGDWSGGGPLNLIPFSDTLGITGPAKGVELSGFLERRGVIPENVPGFDRFDIPRLGLDIIGDPLSYTVGLGFGKALGRGGQALRSAGLLDDLQRASGLGPREFLSSRTLADVLPTLKPVQRESLETAARPLGGIDALSRDPLGGQLGFGPIFGDPLATIGSPRIGRALDIAGEAIRTSPPARLAAAAFDYRTKGRVGKAEQAFQREVTRTQESELPLAKMASIHTNRTLKDLYQQFADEFGEELFKQADDIDPRDLEDAIQEVLARKTAEWEMGAPEREFRQRYFYLIQRARGDVDADTVSRAFDEIAEGYRYATGRFDLTTDEIFDILKGGPDPKPTRASVLEEARAFAKEKMLPGAEGAPPWKQGDVVHAADRDNYGWVVKVGPRTSEVFFKNPRTNATATVPLSNDLLTKAFPAGSDEAAYWSQLATAKTFSDIMRHIGETGDVEEAFAFFAPSVRSRIPRTVRTFTPNRYARGGDIDTTSVWVDPKKLDDFWRQTAGPEFYIPQGGGGLARDESMRYWRDQLRDTSQSVESPAIDLRSSTLFTDGRHRFAVLRDLNEPAKLTLPKDQAEEVFARFGSPEGRFVDNMRGTLAELRGARNAVWEGVENMGGKAKWLDREHESLIDHFPRSWGAVKGEEALPREHSKIAPHTSEWMQGRDVETRDLPAAVIRELTRSRRYRGEGAARRIFQDFEDKLDPGWINKQVQDVDDFLPEMIEATAAENKLAHAEAIANWLHNRPAMETRTIMHDHTRYMQDVHTVASTLRATHNFLAASVERFRRAPTEDGVRLADVFKAAGMVPSKALAYFAKRTGIPASEAANLRVFAEDANAVAGVVKMFDRDFERTFAKPFADLYDKLTKTFKTYVTIPWPAFIGRNFGSGQVVNLISGHVQTPADFADYADAFRRAADLLDKARTGNVTADEQQLLDAIQGYQVFHKFQGFSDIEHYVPTEADWLPERIRDVRAHRRAAFDFAEAFPTLASQIPGAGSAVRPIHRGLRTAVQIGSAANQNVEWFNRVPLFLFLKGKGYADEAAAAAVERLHFDYGRLTPAEREVFKRVWPFYTFSRRAAEMVFRSLADKPGGPLAKVIRATSSPGGDEEGLPHYIKETTGIPLGSLPGGVDRYLVGIGLAHEDPLSLVGIEGGRPTLGGTLSELGARSHPLIKGLAELTFGESLFQRGPMGGRELADVTPPIGATLTNLGLREPLPSGQPAPFISTEFEHVMANTPFARLLSTTRMLTDPRKYQASGGPLDFVPGQAAATQLLTGLRLAEVSPLARLRAIEDEIKAAIRREGGFARPIIRFTQKDIERAEKQDPARARRMRRLNQALADLAKAKRELGEKRKPLRLLRRSQ